MLDAFHPKWLIGIITGGWAELNLIRGFAMERGQRLDLRSEFVFGSHVGLVGSGRDGGGMNENALMDSDTEEEENGDHVT